MNHVLVVLIRDRVSAGGVLNQEYWLKIIKKSFVPKEKA